MKCRATRLVCSVSLLIANATTGCYAHHTADEELLDIGFPDDVYPDAGSPVAGDASTPCTQSDPIQLLLCQFTQGGGNLGSLPGLGGNGQTPDLAGLELLIGRFLSGGETGNLQELLALLAGLQGQSPLPGTGTGQTPSLEDILDLLGAARVDAGVRPTLPTVSAQQCASAADVGTRLLCALNGLPTPGQGRDGGTSFGWPPGLLPSGSSTPVR